MTQTSVNKTTLLDGVEVGTSKWRISMGCFIDRVHEAMNTVSNVKVHLRTRSGNVNILNAKNLAPFSISIFFSGSKLITSNFSVILMMNLCRKIIFVTNSNAYECLGIQRHFFVEKMPKYLFFGNNLS